MIIFNTIKQYLKVILVEIVNLILLIFWIFPVRNNQIYFSAYNGQYCCNPKYIYEFFNKTYKDRFIYIWVGIGNENMCYANTIFIKKKSLKHIYYLLTSKIIVANTHFSSYIPFKKNQILINTWHGGGAYKKIGLINIEKFRAIYILYALRKMSKNTNYFISSNSVFTEVIAESMFLEKFKFLPYGMPRNDIFFNSSLNRDAIKNRIGIEQSKSIILYAPTFRSENKDNKSEINYNDLGYSSVIEAARKRFNKEFILLYRYHHLMKNINIENSLYLNVSAYPDIQELLYITDIFITDYSSSMWDFSLMYRPGFLFTPDIHEYEEDQGLYTPISQWPFPFSTTLQQLCESILNFDEERNVEKIKQHHNVLGSYEDGNATKKIADLIIKALEE